MKNIIYSLLILIGCYSISCTKDFSDVNTNPNQFDLTFPDPLFLASQLNTVKQLESYNNNTMNGLWQYTQWITNYTGGYDIFTNSNNWDPFYLKMLPNLRQLHLKYDSDPNYKNRMAVANIWECYIYTILVQSYGPIPYRQAELGGTKPGDMTYGTINIPFDSEDTICLDLLRRLRKAAADIDLTKTSDAYGRTYDNIFYGDNSKWIKFANSLRLRLALDCRTFMKDTAENMIKDLMAHESNLIASSADNAAFTFANVDGSYSQYYTDFIYPTYTAFYNNNTAIPVLNIKMNDVFGTYFRSYKDPRLAVMFDSASYTKGIGASGNAPYTVTSDTLVSNGTMDPTMKLHYIVSYYPSHVGKGISDRNNIAGGVPCPVAPAAGYYDQPKCSLLDKTHPHVLMSYADICYLKAEAAMLGLGGSSTAQAYYNAGLDASLTFWGVPSTSAKATAFKAVPGIQWGTVGNGLAMPLCGTIKWNIPNDTAKIWVQRWVNYYPDQAWDAWVLMRRTRCIDVPPLVSGVTPSTSLDPSYKNVPERWAYPTTASVITNPVGYLQGVKLLGGDTQWNLLRFERGPKYRDWRALGGDFMANAMSRYYKFFGPYVENYVNNPGYVLAKTY